MSLSLLLEILILSSGQNLKNNNKIISSKLSFQFKLKNSNHENYNRILKKMLAGWEILTSLSLVKLQFRYSR